MSSETYFGMNGRPSGLIEASVVGMILAGLFVSNRFYWRFALAEEHGEGARRRGLLGFDDLFILLSLFFLIVMVFANFFAVMHGYGRHSFEVGPKNREFALKMFWLNQLCYKFTINFGKLSLVLLYLRCFNVVWFRRFCWSMLAIITVYGLSSIVVTFLQCIPLKKFWSESTPGVCIDSTGFWYANAAYTMLTDLAITGTVPFAIDRVDLLGARYKAGLIFGTSLLLIVCVFTVARMTTLDDASDAADPLYGTVKSTFWTMVEASATIVCACLSLARHVLPATVRKWCGDFFGKLFEVTNTMVWGARARVSSLFRGRTGPGAAVAAAVAAAAADAADAPVAEGPNAIELRDLEAGGR